MSILAGESWISGYETSLKKAEYKWMGLFPRIIHLYLTSEATNLIKNSKAPNSRIMWVHWKEIFHNKSGSASYYAE